MSSAVSRAIASRTATLLRGSWTTAASSQSSLLSPPIQQPSRQFLDRPINNQNTTARYLSSSADDSSSSSITSYNPMDWWKNRQSRKEQEKFQERTLAMANANKWTLGDMTAELDEATGWKSNLPGMSGSKEVKMAKEMKGILDAFIEILGKDATDKDLQKLQRIDKLRVASKADVSVGEVNQVIDQMENMSVVQKVLRKRQKTGKKLPMTQENLMFVVQNEGLPFMSKRYKEKAIKQASRGMGALGGRR